MKERRTSKVGTARYVPGDPGPAGAIVLNTNEAPWAPSADVVRAIADSAAQSHRYPDPHSEPLRSQIANHHGLPPSCVLVSSGADGLLDGCFRAFVGPGDRVRLSVPTYPLIRVLCDVYAARQVESPWPLQAGAEATVTVIANPNSPTGQWLPPDELRNFIAAQTGIVVIDEAYAPFTGYSAIAFLLDFPNLIVVRTFSKAYSLAGMRVGYALADPVLIDEIRSAHLPYPTSTCGLAAASVALADGHRLEQMIALVVAERSRVQRELLVLGWDAPPSHGNFLYVRPPAGTALDACETLARNGVLIRYFPGIDKDRLRVTISSSSSNDAFLTAARSIAHDL